MRPREEVLEDFEDYMESKYGLMADRPTKLVIEVLLDIRDLLRELREASE